MMKTKLIGAIALAGAMAVSTSAAANETISVVGSSSVSPLMEVFGETYSKANNVTVEVQGPGSSAGIRVAHDGSADFGMSSRSLKTEEEGPSIKEVVIARDGIAVVVNPKNPVTNLTKEQVSEIYKGDITNWKQVGGNDQPIVVATRDTASGTRGAFEDIMSLKKKINGIKVSAISPSVAAIKSGDYSVQRPFIVVYKDGRPSSQALEFLSWMTSADAQKIVADKGFISVN